jgi:hypothetical protein
MCFFGMTRKLYWRLRCDVVESDDLVVFIKLVRGDVPSDDLAEQTIHGASPKLDDWSVTGRFETGQPVQGAAMRAVGYRGVRCRPDECLNSLGPGLRTGLYADARCVTLTLATAGKAELFGYGLCGTLDPDAQ